MAGRTRREPGGSYFGPYAGSVLLHLALFALGEAARVAPGTELKVRLRFEASKSKRAIGQFRLSAAQNEDLVQLLNPPKFDSWQVIGPFKTQGLQHGYTNVFDPELAVASERAAGSGPW